MKIALFSMLFVLYSHIVFGMDDEATEKVWQAQIELSCRNLRRYEPSKYACACTKFYHRLFNTGMRQNEVTKTQQIDVLLTHLIDRSWSKERVYDFINEEMVPFDDDYEKQFHSCVNDILATKMNDDALCKICMERVAVYIFFPCGHLVACETCAADYESSKKQNGCTQCRDEILSMIKIRIGGGRKCHGCGRNPPNTLFPECRHLIWCDSETCFKNTCTMCNQERTKAIKIFYQ